MYLLDTNTCIKYLNGTSDKIKENFRSSMPEEIFLCSIVKAELYYGALKSAKPKDNFKKIFNFVNRFHSLPFDDNAAEKYGEIRTSLERSGTPIGPNDLLIASIAVSNDKIVVTNNVREFSRVQGLIIKDWEK